jgi:hypothetical protein
VRRGRAARDRSARRAAQDPRALGRAGARTRVREFCSPTIRVNGRDVAPETLESECGADACGCAPGASCRVWSYGGREYTEAPVGLIVDAILSELYGGEPRAALLAAAYELPENLVRVFAAKDADAPGGGCCG